MIIYSTAITHRLYYMADFLGRYLTGEPALVTADPAVFCTTPVPRINYSSDRIMQDEIWIQPQGLLTETGIRQQETECFERNGYTAFFKTEGHTGFDMLAAIFYLLSRYEEYLPHRKDVYGRYAHEQSLAFRAGFLDRPLVDSWLLDLRRLLQEHFPDFVFQNHFFRFLPTYDIDEAWSYRYKEWHRSAGAAVKDLLLGRFKRFAQRRRVLNGKETDPYDSFDWLHDLHRPVGVPARYFFLVAEKNRGVDKNILPRQTALQTLLQQHAGKYPIGVHPSWQSGDDPGLLLREMETIERITKEKITASRQHYIRFSLPATYRQLTEAGIREDFSMGYGSINGFRASVATPFYWYDLEAEQQTPLLLFPFCYMEANSFFEQRYSAPQALDEMYRYYHEVKKVNGLLITIWHNTFLGTDPLFEGWREVYAQFFREAAGTPPQN